MGRGFQPNQVSRNQGISDETEGVGVLWLTPVTRGKELLGRGRVS